MGLEPELESHVGERIVVVVDLDFVNDGRVKGEVVGSVAWLQERIDIHYECDAIWMVVADKRVEIGDVSGVIQRGNRGLPMARRERPGRHCNE